MRSCSEFICKVEKKRQEKKRIMAEWDQVTYLKKKPMKAKEARSKEVCYFVLSNCLRLGLLIIAA